MYSVSFGIFLDDVSTREQFAFLVYCYGVKAIFHTGVCVAQQIGPIVKYPRICWYFSFFVSFLLFLFLFYPLKMPPLARAGRGGPPPPPLCYATVRNDLYSLTHLNTRALQSSISCHHTNCSLLLGVNGFYVKGTDHNQRVDPLSVCRMR